MREKNRNRLRLVLYAVVLLMAVLLDNAAFSALHTRYVPTVMPVAVACIAMWEGSDRGCLFGLAGGCVWAWNFQLSYFGAWCILSMTIVGSLAGVLAERFLLRSWKTAFCVSAGALMLSNGVYTLIQSVAGNVSADSFFTQFLPEGLISLAFVVCFYPATAYISEIGGFHG